MKDALQTAAAVIVLLAAGGGITWFAGTTVARLGAVEASHAQLVDDLNKKVLPEVQKQLEAVKPKTPAAPAAKKGE